MGIGFGKIVKTCRSRSTAAMALRAACSSINITDYTHTLCRYSVIRDTNRASFVWEVYPDLTPPQVFYDTAIGRKGRENRVHDSYLNLADATFLLP